MTGVPNPRYFKKDNHWKNGQMDQGANGECYYITSLGTYSGKK